MNNRFIAVSSLILEDGEHRVACLIVGSQTKKMLEHGDSSGIAGFILEFGDSLEGTDIVRSQFECVPKRHKRFVFVSFTLKRDPLHRPKLGVLGRRIKRGMEQFEGLLEVLLAKSGDNRCNSLIT